MKILKFEFENKVVIYEFEFEVEEQCKHSKEPSRRIKYCQKKARKLHVASDCSFITNNTKLLITNNNNRWITETC